MHKSLSRERPTKPQSSFLSTNITNVLLQSKKWAPQDQNSDNKEKI